MISLAGEQEDRSASLATTNEGIPAMRGSCATVRSFPEAFSERLIAYDKRKRHEREGNKQHHRCREE